MVALRLPCHAAKYGDLDFPFTVKRAGGFRRNANVKVNHLREKVHFIAIIDFIVSVFGVERRVYKNPFTGGRFLGVNNSIRDLRKDSGNKFSKFHRNLQQQKRKNMDNFTGMKIEKAPRRTTGERPQNEERAINLHPSLTTPKACAQLPPLAADLEGLAVSVGVLAGRVSAEDWEFLKMLRANLRAVSERVAVLENSLEVPHVQA